MPHFSSDWISQVKISDSADEERGKSRPVTSGRTNLGRIGSFFPFPEFLVLLSKIIIGSVPLKVSTTFQNTVFRPKMYTYLLNAFVHKSTKDVNFV